LNQEALDHELLLIKQSIDMLQETLAPDLKTRDLMLLRYGYTVNETRELDCYFYELFQSKTSVSFEDYHQKVCKIRGLPHISKIQTEDILIGYKASGLYTQLMSEILRSK